MAKLLLINLKTYREGRNQIGDIVTVMPDDYRQGNGDLSFDVKYIKGTVEEIRHSLQSIIPPDVKAELNAEPEEQSLDRLSKYEFKLVDDKEATISEACVCNVRVRETISSEAL